MRLVYQQKCSDELGKFFKTEENWVQFYIKNQEKIVSKTTPFSRH